MKKIFLPLLAILLTTAACNKKDSAASNERRGTGSQRSGNMKVVRDCTGTYLQFDGKDYFVCNKSRLAPFADGSMVNAAFSRVTSCPASDDVVCMMYHEHAGTVEVTSAR